MDHLDFNETNIVFEKVVGFLFGCVLGYEVRSSLVDFPREYKYSLQSLLRYFQGFYSLTTPRT